jgi:DUF1016 N-terminal domain
MKQKRRKAQESSVLVTKGLLQELRELIQSARQTVALAVNTGLTLLYWRVGERIRKEILKERRAQYGEEILQALSTKLVGEFGRGFSPRYLTSITKLPLKDLLRQRLHQALTQTRARLEHVVEDGH